MMCSFQAKTSYKPVYYSLYYVFLLFQLGGNQDFKDSLLKGFKI